MAWEWHTILDNHRVETGHIANGAISFRMAGAVERQERHLILLHDINSCSDGWAYQLNELVSEVCIHAWDAPGYGQSARVGHASADGYAEALTNFLDRYQIRRPVILGHGMGAIIAARLAVRFPVQVRALILYGPMRGEGHLAGDARAAKLAARVKRFHELGVENIAWKDAPYMLADDAGEEQTDLMEACIMKLNDIGYGDAARCVSEYDLMRDLKYIETPVALIGGGADDITPPEETCAIAEACPTGSVYRDIRGGGHACHIDSTKAFNAEIITLLHKFY